MSEPGHTDLTANVDFSYLSEAMADLGTSQPPPVLYHSLTPPLLATSHGPMDQSAFLHSLGFDPRLRGLLKNAADDRKVEIESAAQRLVDTLGMGKQYKVMAITPKGGEVVDCFPFPAVGGEKKV